MMSPKMMRLALPCVLLCSCASVSAGGPASMPKELQGVWQLGYEPCNLPGNLDSDDRIEIKSRLILGYEDSSEPLKVTVVSKRPAAWRIEYLKEIDDYADRYSAIFALSGDHTLTVVDESRPAIYTRCR